MGNKRTDLLTNPVKQIDFTKFDGSTLVEDMKHMGFSSRNFGRACDIYMKMLKDEGCVVMLSLAGSTGAAGCLDVYRDLIKYGFVDVVVATGASIIDMDFFEALGFKHYQGNHEINDVELRKLRIDRIYDTYIDEDELQICDLKVKGVADEMEPGVYSSRQFIRNLGSYLEGNSEKESLILTAHRNNVPIFCPAFSDSSAGLGLVKHQIENPEHHISIDSVKDFREITQLKIKAKNTGLVIIGGGVPKNFVQDIVVAAEILGEDVPMHKYAIQITVADQRDGALSGSTLKEAGSWGKVSNNYEQMVFAEATTLVPLMASYVFHNFDWKSREKRNMSKLLKG